MATTANIDFRGRDSGFYIILVPALIIITLHAEVCSALDANLEYCNNTSYSTGSDFESNLNRVFNSLVLNTSQTGYNTSVYGQSPDRVYGLLQCRGDATVDQCYNCSRNATTSIRQIHNCGRAIGGRIWLDFCFLRYENYSFIGVLDTYGYYVYKTYNVSNGVFNVFNGALEYLLSNLSAEAADGSSRNRYASGTTAGHFFPNIIYALVQCTRDISINDCIECLLQGASDIKENYNGCSGVQYFMGSCIVSYEPYLFFNSPAPEEAPVVDRRRSPPAAEEPANNPGVTQSNNSTHSKKIRIILGVVAGGGLFLALLVCLLTTRNRRLIGYEGLLSNLSSKAESGSKLYASGTTIDSLFRKIYGLVQCWRDISSDDCTTCLSNTINSISITYLGNPGVNGLMANCIIRYEIYPFFNSALSPPPAATPVNNTPSSYTKKSSHRMPIILGVVGGFLLALLVCLFATGRRLKSAIKRRGYEDRGKIEEDTLISEDPQLVSFKMETLLAATENFHDDNKLGQGGFVPVYKGTTQDGKEIAVKKMSLNSTQGKKEFLNEVKLVAKIQHRNLVKLLGYCVEESETVIVYEYLPNRSLDKILFHPNNRKQLDWQKRYNIIMGVARGLLYLHQDSLLRIIHRDIKASNILLDENLNPKIADFGLAKHFPEDESHISTRLAGTFGYMAPEYAMQGQLSVKSDVYSFGVLLLELITGRKNTDYSLSPEMQILIGWTWRSYERGNSVEMIDPAIIETCDEAQALRCIHVGLLCTQAEASLRPPMSTATLMLASDSATLPNPTKPVYMSSNTQITNPTGLGFGSSHASASTASASSLTHLAPASHATASISDLVAR